MHNGLTEWLDAYNKEVRKYSEIKWNDRAELNTLLKRMTIILSQLEHERCQAYDKHNGILFSFEGPVSRAQIEADKEVPELYMLRRIMTAGYRICDSIRSNISSLNKEE